MICKDCIHYEICDKYVSPCESFPETDGCKCFKDKSRYIELPCGKGAKLTYKGIEYTVDHWNILATAFAELPPQDTRSKIHLFDVEGARNAMKGAENGRTETD